MNWFKKFTLRLLGQHYPETISKQWDEYLDNRKGGWGFYYCTNKKGDTIAIDKEVFYKLILSGYYAESKFHSWYVQYKLI